MKSKILSLIILTTITTGIFIGCNSNNSSKGSKEASETNVGDGKSVQSDSLSNDTIYTHRGIQENNSEVKK